jgi:hypothetical protein
MRATLRGDLVSSMRETATAPKRQRILIGLFALQLGIVLFMVATAGSLLGTLREANRRVYPFRTDNLLFMDANLRAAGHAASTEDTQGYLRALLERIRSVSGVIRAGAGTGVPLGGSGWTNLIFDGKDPNQESDHNFVLWSFVAPGFIEALGLPQLVGRTIDEHDFAGKADVAVVDRAAADRFWPGANAVGKSFQPWPGGPRLVVIGVIPNVPAQNHPLMTPRVYIPAFISDGSYYTLAIAVDRDSANLRRRLEASLAGVWPYRHVPEMRSIEDQIGNSLSDLTATVEIALWATGFATLITVFGFYFFSAYLVSITLKDAAVRMALGARPAEVVRAHLLRFRWGVAGGFLLGGALMICGDGLWNRLAVRVTASPIVSLIDAAAVIIVIAAAGLSFPLRRILAPNNYHLLHSDAE